MNPNELFIEELRKKPKVINTDFEKELKAAYNSAEYFWDLDSNEAIFGNDANKWKAVAAVAKKHYDKNHGKETE